MACCAISSGVMGRCGDIVGVWMAPVMAQVMMTFFFGRALMVDLSKYKKGASFSKALVQTTPIKVQLKQLVEPAALVLVCSQ